MYCGGFLMESLQLLKGHYLSNLISGSIQNINYRLKKKKKACVWDVECEAHTYLLRARLGWH